MSDNLFPEFQASADSPVTGPISLGKKLGLQAGDALVVVDVQRDFLPVGALAVPEGDAVVPRLNAYMAAFGARHLPIFLTRDWHPQNHCSFKEQGGQWPAHCVQGTAGADWPAELQIPDTARIISKGTDPSVETYSGFAGTMLLEMLRGLEVRRLFIGGLATDYCVHDTVFDARAQGFEVVLLADAVRAVNAEPANATRAIREMLERGARVFEAVPAVKLPRRNV